jgi:hypothetical protein
MHQKGYVPPTSRPQRTEPSLGCRNCFLFSQCGGTYAPGVFDCLAFCCNKPSTCTFVCPKSDRFVEVVRDTGGLALNQKWDIRQRDTGLPHYLPCIQHGSSRMRRLNFPLVVVPTCEVTRRQAKPCESPADLRAAFKLRRDARIILVTIDEDRELENFWRVKAVRSLAERLAGLNVEHIVAPNFSLPLEIPRFDNIANIRRSLLCAEEFSRAGMSVIPYVAGVTEHDWNFWEGFLREHVEIKIVAKEFQTGASNNQVADWHIGHLLRLQDRVKRGLHIVAVGGRRHLRNLIEFSGISVMDSNPFMKTCHRFALAASGVWEEYPTALNEPLDNLLLTNILRYTELVETAIRDAVKVQHKIRAKSMSAHSSADVTASSPIAAATKVGIAQHGQST